MQDINDFLSELAKGSTHIIANPETLKELEKQGADIKHITKTADQFVEELFKQRRLEALAIIEKLPKTPTIAIPEIETLYNEIRECILFGLYGAAISLSAILVEFSIKYAIVKKKSGETYSQEEWDRIESMELGSVIVEAKNIELIDGKMVKQLNSFKNTVRNPYLHYNIKKLTKDVVAPKVKHVNLKTRTMEELDVLAKDNPIIWDTAKRFVDKQMFLNVYDFANQLVIHLFVAD